MTLVLQICRSGMLVHFLSLTAMTPRGRLVLQDILAVKFADKTECKLTSNQNQL